MREKTGKSSRRWLRAVAAALAAVPFLVTGFAPRPETGAEAMASSMPEAGGPAVVAEPAELVWLEPGTRFRDDAPPPGWTHVAFKSIPVLASGDLGTLSPEARVTARRIRLTVLAEVDGSNLRRVGVGLAAPVVGEGADAGDVIVAATNVGDVSGSWSTKERIVLAAGSRELGRASLAAATPTFALLRTPTTCLVGREHATVDVTYALLVESGSNRLRFLACKPAVCGAAAVVRELKTPAVVDGPLDVKATTFAGFAVSWSFAMIDLPPGDARDVPETLERLLAPERLETAAAHPEALEAAFRALAARPTLASAVGRGRDSSTDYAD